MVAGVNAGESMNLNNKPGMKRITANQSAAHFPVHASRAIKFAALLLSGMLVPSPVAGAATPATSTSLAITSNGLNVAAVNAGAVVTLTATVETGGKAVAPGQVNFCDASASSCTDIHLLGTAQLNSTGKAAFKFVPRVGTHAYKAQFAGTVNAASSASSELSLVVYGTTKTTIAATGTAGNYTLKATVAGLAADAAPAGGVDFVDTSNKNSVLATATLGAGKLISTWVNTQNPATRPQPLSITTGDFNGDGIPDVAIGTTGSATGYLSILPGNGDGTFKAASTFTALPNNQAMVAAPFVTGGPLDILTVSSNATGTNNVALFSGNGAGSGTVGAPFSLGGLSAVTSVAAGDFNRDGNQDFVVTGVIYGVYCFAPVLGTGKGTFGGPTLNAIGSNPVQVAVGAFGKSGYPDIVVADMGADQVTIFENNGQGYFSPAGQANTGKNPSAMVAGDFNGDGYLDLAVVNGGSNDVSIFFGKGNYTLTPGTTVATGASPTSIAVGDFNEDGIADLAVVNSAGKSVSILLGKGDGTFTVGPALATGINPVNVVTGDFSGSGPADLVVTNQDIANTPGSTLTVLAAELTDAATATATGVAAFGAGAHLVDASYEGDSLYDTSVSTTTSLTGVANPAASPVFSPAGGNIAAGQKVTITDATKGAVLYYTTNGTKPTTSSNRYTGAITVSASETIEAVAMAAGYSDSEIVIQKYVIAAALPVFKPAGGTYSSAQNVTVTDTTNGAVIYYTTDGTTPTTGSTKYTGAIPVAKSETIKAIAAANGFANSGVSPAVYTIK